MIGQTLNHYEVIEKLGEGGMGNVYLAEDTRLNRRVALKVLRAEMSGDAERIDRFEREAKAVAALNHPNIVTIYSVEEAGEVRFLTMELVDGNTLDDLIPFGGMKLEEFFEVATPLAHAVAAAHRKGITHRDIKPANVMVNSEGVVKLLDLGLAKLREPESEDDPSVTRPQTLTREDRVLGTVPYMAPEQLASKPTDHRVDLFSLGVVLYQMLTGVRPFQGESSAELISSILRDPPAPLTEVKRSLPTHLARLVQKCLEKEPDNRLATAADLARELESLTRLHDRGELHAAPTALSTHPAGNRRTQWLLGLAIVLAAAVATNTLLSLSGSEQPEPPAPVVVEAPAPPSLAVLPVTELGIGGAAGFAQGLTDEISTTLTHLDELAIVSSAGAPLDLPRRRLGERLGADYLLQGAIRWAPGEDGGLRARTTFELIRTEDERHLWSQTYEREVVDLFTDQIELAGEVRRQVALQLGFDPPPDEGPPPDVSNEAQPPAEVPETAQQAAPSAPRALRPEPRQVETPPRDAPAEPRPATPIPVGLELTSKVSTGVLTLYADTVEVYRHPFQFVERKKGLLGRVGLKRKVSGAFQGSFDLPPGTQRLRLYVALSEQPARQLVFVPELRGDGSDRLVVRIDDSGVVEAQLQ